MKDKTPNEKELKRLEYIIKELKTKGLEKYEENKELVLEYCIKGVEREAENIRKKIKEMQEVQEATKEQE